MKEENEDGYQGDKRGILEFYMNNEVVRIKRYYSPAERKRIIEDWLFEIRNITAGNEFFYKIIPIQKTSKGKKILNYSNVRQLAA